MKTVHCFPTATAAAAAKKPTAFFQLCGSPIRTGVQLSYEEDDERDERRAPATPTSPTTPTTPPIGSPLCALTQAAARLRVGNEGDDEEEKVSVVATNEDGDVDAPADVVTTRVSPLSLEKAQQAGIPYFMAPWNESKTDQPSVGGATGRGARTPPLVHIAMSELRLGRVLGEGAFGRVFMGRWKRKHVAVKVLLRQNLSDDVVREFETEVKIMSYLNHPNICALLGACLEPMNRALVVELLPRGCLWSVLQAYRRGLTVKMRSQMVLDIACGMHYLHSFTRPILHRDMKSPNLLVDEDFSIKISDFGLARVKAHIQTMTGNCGTVQWMAPEVLGNHKYTEKADVFSFGIVVWEIFTGRCPYDGMTQIQAALSVLNHDLRPSIPSSCPKFFARLMKMCWTRDPEKRPSFAFILHLYETQVLAKTHTASADADAAAATKRESSAPSRAWKP